MKKIMFSYTVNNGESIDKKIMVMCEPMYDNSALLRLTDISNGKYEELTEIESRFLLAYCEGRFIGPFNRYSGSTSTNPDTVSSTKQKINDKFAKLGFEGGLIKHKKGRGADGASILEEGITWEIMNPDGESSHSVQNKEEVFYAQELEFSQKIKVQLNKQTTVEDLFKSGQKCLFVYGAGGTGKTHLLKSLENNSIKDEVKYISLSRSFDRIIRNPFEQQRSSLLDINPITDKVLLLDGLNELFDRNNCSTNTLITRIIDEIQVAVKNPKILKIIITSRNMIDFSFLDLHESRKNIILKATLSGVNDNALSSLPDNIQVILRKPLFYSQAKRYQALEKILNGKQSTYNIWKEFHQIACKHEIEKRNISMEEAIFIYYILLPYIGYHITSVRSGDEIGEKTVHQLLADLSSSTTSERNKFIINEKIKEQLGKDRTVRLSNVSISFEMLYYISNFIEIDDKDDEKKVRFIHQDIREYFAAFYIIWYVKSTKTIVPTLSSVPNLNLPTSVQNLVLAGLCDGITNTPAPQNRKEFGKKLIVNILPPSNTILTSLDLNDVQHQISEGVALVFLDFEFTDHFLFQKHDAQYELLAPFCNSMIESTAFLKDYVELLSVKEKSALLKAFSAIIMYHRIEHEYAEAEAACQFCFKYLKRGCGEYYSRFIRHQNAKALLMYSIDKHENPDVIKSHYSGKKDVDPKLLFNEALKLLEKCLPFELTANTLAMIFNKPAPAWLLSENWVKQDVIHAFNYYQRAYDVMCNPHYPYPPNGDDVAYTVHEMAFMLITGRVLVENYEEKKLVIGKASPLCGDKNGIGEATIKYAEEILDKLKGLKYRKMHWQLGVIALYYGDENKAEKHFSEDAGYFLTKIVRYTRIERYKNDEDLKQEIIEELDVYKRKKWNYWLEDAYRMGWNEEHSDD